jgi:hypothetical protein
LRRWWQNVFTKNHGKTDGYHLKKVLKSIKNGDLDDEFSGVARKIMILDRFSLIFLVLAFICFYVSLLTQNQPA